MKELIIENDQCILGERIFQGCTSLTKLKLPLHDGKRCFYRPFDVDEIGVVNLVLSSSNLNFVKFFGNDSLSI